MVDLELSQPIPRRPQKPAQVRRAYQKRGNRPRQTETEKRQIERMRVLEKRAEDARRKELRRKELNVKKREREEDERERRRQLGHGVPAKPPRASQYTIGNFFKPRGAPNQAQATVQKEKDAPDPENNPDTSEDEFEEMESSNDESAYSAVDQAQEDQEPEAQLPEAQLPEAQLPEAQLPENDLLDKQLVEGPMIDDPPPEDQQLADEVMEELPPEDQVPELNHPSVPPHLEGVIQPIDESRSLPSENGSSSAMSEKLHLQLPSLGKSHKENLPLRVSEKQLSSWLQSQRESPDKTKSHTPSKTQGQVRQSQPNSQGRKVPLTMRERESRDLAWILQSQSKSQDNIPDQVQENVTSKIPSKEPSKSLTKSPSWSTRNSPSHSPSRRPMRQQVIRSAQLNTARVNRKSQEPTTGNQGSISEPLIADVRKRTREVADDGSQIAKRQYQEPKAKVSFHGRCLTHRVARPTGFTNLELIEYEDVARFVASNTQIARELREPVIEPSTSKQNTAPPGDRGTRQQIPRPTASGTPGRAGGRGMTTTRSMGPPPVPSPVMIQRQQTFSPRTTRFNKIRPQHTTRPVQPGPQLAENAGEQDAFADFPKLSSQELDDFGSSSPPYKKHKPNKDLRKRGTRGNKDESGAGQHSSSDFELGDDAEWADINPDDLLTQTHHK